MTEYTTPLEMTKMIFSSLDEADFNKTVDVVISLNEAGMLENFAQEELDSLRDYIYAHKDWMAAKVLH